MTQPVPQGDTGASGARAGPDAPNPPSAGPPPSDDQDFADFYRGHFSRLVAYLIYLGATVHLAAEFAQEAMTTAYRRWDTINSPRAYVWTVASRAYIRFDFDAEEPVPDVPEPTVLLCHPEYAERWVQKQQVLDVLRALPLRQRQVLALTIDGWTHAEIAGLLDIGAAAVRANLMKARRSADEHRRRIGEEDS